MSTTSIVVVGFTVVMTLWLTTVTALDGRRRVSREVAKRHRKYTMLIWLLLIVNVLKAFTGAYH
jgi:hypothetical protein